jgi:hypothetical protein
MIARLVACFVTGMKEDTQYFSAAAVAEVENKSSGNWKTKSQIAEEKIVARQLTGT